jgi:hypothetical protein
MDGGLAPHLAVHVLGSEECQALMQQLQEQMLAIASDTGADCVTCVLQRNAV